LEQLLQSVRKLFDGYLEMPAVAPAAFSQRHRFVYGYHSIFEDPQIAVAKVDTIANTVDLWKPGPYRFALEPRFVPRNRAISEDDGYIIAQLFDSERLESHIVILDAADVAAGPVAVLGLRDALPHGLHSCWTDEYYGPSDEDQEAGQKKELRGNVVKFRKKESTNSRIAGSGETRRSTPRGGI
jgi:carotenoid cleavage dioxygenase-like enzyme